MTDKVNERTPTGENEAQDQAQVEEEQDGKDHPSGRRSAERGFASMDRDKQREIASRGGRAAHQKGTAHQFTSEEARAAGRKGGEKVSKNREHMSEIGSRGGKASHEKNQDEEDSTD
jgi:general stress protein YciG